MSIRPLDIQYPSSETESHIGVIGDAKIDLIRTVDVDDIISTSAANTGTSPTPTRSRSLASSTAVSAVDVPFSPVAGASSLSTQLTRIDGLQSGDTILTTENAGVRPAIRRSLSAQFSGSDDEDTVPFFIHSDDEEADALGAILGEEEETPDTDDESVPLFDAEAFDSEKPPGPEQPELSLTEQELWDRRVNAEVNTHCTCGRPIEDIIRNEAIELSQYPENFDPLTDDMPSTVENLHAEMMLSNMRSAVEIMKKHGFKDLTDKQIEDINLLRDYATFKSIKDFINDKVDMTSSIKIAINNYRSQKGAVFEYSQDNEIVPTKPTGLKNIPGIVEYKTQETSRGWVISTTKWVPQDTSQEIAYGVTLADVLCAADGELMFYKSVDVSLHVFDEIYLSGTDKALINRINDTMKKWVNINYLNSLYVNSDILAYQSSLARGNISYGHICCRNTIMTSMKRGNLIKQSLIERGNRSILENIVSASKSKSSTPINALEVPEELELFPLVMPNNIYFGEDSTNDASYDDNAISTLADDLDVDADVDSD